MGDVDSSKNKSSWGGRREGSGRPKGSMNTSSKERMVTKAAYIDRVNKNADKLFNAQLDLAIGEKYLMVIRTIGKGAKQRKETSVVTDPEVIKQYLDEELVADDEEFYFMTTKPANNMAIDSLLNRSFGKAEEKLSLANDTENPLTVPADKTLVDTFIEALKNATTKQTKSD